MEWPDGRCEALLFVVEEENNPSRFSIHRLAHYCLDLAELCKTDKVIPVVIFLHEGNYPCELILGGDRHSYLRFHYLVCDLPQIPFEQYRRSDNIVARVNLPNMRYAPEQKVDVYADAVEGVVTLEQDKEKQSKYIDFIDIYAELDDNEIEQYRREYLEEVENMSSLAQVLRQEGILEGEKRGEKRGRAARGGNDVD